MKRSLQKVLNLIDKTGETTVIYDSSTDKSYVLLDFSVYEKLLASQHEMPKQIDEKKLLEEDMRLFREVRRELAPNDTFPEPENEVEGDGSGETVLVQVDDSKESEALDKDSQFIFEDVEEEKEAKK